MKRIRILVNGKEYEPRTEEKVPVAVECWYDRHRREWVIYPIDDEGNQLEEARYGFGKKEALEIKADLERQIETKLMFTAYEEFQNGREF